MTDPAKTNPKFEQLLVGAIGDFVYATRGSQRNERDATSGDPESKVVLNAPQRGLPGRQTAIGY